MRHLKTHYNKSASSTLHSHVSTAPTTSTVDFDSNAQASFANTDLNELLAKHKGAIKTYYKKCKVLDVFKINLTD